LARNVHGELATGEDMKLRWRLLISLAPVLLALVGKLLIDLPKAKILIYEPNFYNISVDLLLASFGILLGSLIVAYKDDKIRKDIFICTLLLFGVLLCSLGLSVIVPNLMGDPAATTEILLSVALPDLLALSVFGFAVGVGT
jgi:hypothetical protein